VGHLPVRGLCAPRGVDAVVNTVKRSLMFNLVWSWCVLNTFLSWLHLSAFVGTSSRVGLRSLLLANLWFFLWLVGTIGVRRKRRWAAWLCVSILGLFTIDLPFGYRWAISRGGNSGPLLVLFSGLATGNVLATIYLARIGYRGYFLNQDENLKSSS
jgi:hypothetical protein